MKRLIILIIYVLFFASIVDAKFYVQINENNIVTGVQESPLITAPDYIEIDSYDLSLLGKEYKGGEFIAGPVRVPVETAAEALAKQIDIEALGNDNTGKAIKAILLKLGLIK